MADLNETITKLSESLSQHSAAALVNLTLPEFDGSPSQDINTFMKKFKSATITLNDSLKCLALDRCLVGPAHTWSKNTIKADLKTGNWRSAKQALLKRFQAPDQVLRYLDKLSKLKYNPEAMTLSSYVEVFADIYKKAHSNCMDQDILRSLSLKLTPEIILHLNMLSDSWVTLDSMRDFMSLIQRVEHKILPYERSTKTDENNNLAKLTEAIQELKNTVISKNEDDRNSQAKQTEVLAAVAREPMRYPRRDQGVPNQVANYNQPRQQQGYRGSYQNIDNSHYNGPQNQINLQDRNKRGNYYPGTGNQDKRPRTDLRPPDDLQRQYEQRFGRPPGPCYTCNGNHFNKHCPYNELKN